MTGADFTVGVEMTGVLLGIDVGIANGVGVGVMLGVALVLVGFGGVLVLVGDFDVVLVLVGFGGVLVLVGDFDVVLVLVGDFGVELGARIEGTRFPLQSVMLGAAGQRLKKSEKRTMFVHLNAASLLCQIGPKLQAPHSKFVATPVRKHKTCLLSD